MKKLIFSLIVIVVAVILWNPQPAIPYYYDYNFGNYQSHNLLNQAWNAFAHNDIKGVVIYTDKIIELYGEEAREQQAKLKSFPAGSKEEIMLYDKLNNVGTALYIKGEAYQRLNKKEEAIDAFSELISNYSYSQQWDEKGGFWKPAQVAAVNMPSILVHKLVQLNDDGDLR